MIGWLRKKVASAVLPPEQLRAEVSPRPGVPTPDWRALGNDALQAGDLVRAHQCYEQGVAANPHDAAVRLNLGFVLLEQARHAAAAASLQQALALSTPGDGLAHDAQFLLGRAQAALGQPQQALASFAAAVATKPGFVEPMEQALRLCLEAGQAQDALPWAAQLAQARPTAGDVLRHATLLAHCERDAEAVHVLGGLLAQHPGNVDAGLLLCASLRKLRRLDDALAEANRLVSVQGSQPRLLVLRASILERLGRNEEALADVEQALVLGPGDRDALQLRCLVLTNLLRLPEAVAAGDEALQRHPDDAHLHFTLSLALLTAGDMVRGWPEHEWRLRSVLRGSMRELDAYPRWRGEELRGRTIFVHGEQGMGDDIQFLRYVHLLVRAGARVLVMVGGPLERLVAPCLPPGCRLLPQNSPLPAIDFHCALMSLPAYLGTTLENIPAEVPYLRPDAAAVERWRNRLAGERLRVGLMWSGNPLHTNDHHRSLPLGQFRALCVPDVRYVSLQPHVRTADLDALANWPDALDAGPELRDFAETAALVEALDLVVTVDTSVAHLAGALGKPVWILLPYTPDWRWMKGRADSPWYPTARLYRQPKVGDWSSVLQQVRADLAAFAAGR